MKRLKILLHSNYFYIILLVLLTIYCIYFYNRKIENKIDINSINFIGIITNYKIDKDLLTLEVKGREKIISYYYFKSEEEMLSFPKKFKLGDKVLLEGMFKEPSNNTVPNLFNYKKYLKYRNIYLILNANSIKKIGNNKNIFYKIKNHLNNHIYKYKSKAYLETFILGNKNMLDNGIISNYQENGISHLLAISGMHVSILSLIILFILKKIFSINKALITTCLFLIIYMFLTVLSPSIIRTVLLFLLITINKLFNLEVKTLKLFILTFIIVLFINPYFIYDVGFLYSFIISLYLILLEKKIRDNSYFKSLLKVSIISFLVSLPITLYFFYQVNLLSILLNLFFVPFVSIIIFPLALLTFFLPFLDNIFFFFINILEGLNNYFNNYKSFILIFGKVNIFFIVIYYLILNLFLFKNKKRYIFLLFIILFVLYNQNYFFSKIYFIVIDVNQGDSILIHSNNKTLLIDTGGKISFNKEKWRRENISLTDTRIIPLLKSLGIKKLDYLVLSHGDYDHMGEAINLVNNFKVEKVIFNCGEFNNLEKELIKVLDKKKIKYYSCIKELNIDNNKLYFLQTKGYDNENDNSNVIFTELDGYKFMFMGDAGIEKEKDILEKYNISNVDILKVGHHGSKTSSGKEFIDAINPNYSIISVGKNNRYGHPNKEVLNNLDNSKIYRTDRDGSIMFKIKKNKLKIETCSP